jgi:uncharacterized protein involved in exopolysaccharide biosynthesis
MSEQPRESYYEDVIDLRELIQTLWNFKWLIVGATLLAALVAFLVSTYLLPAQYQADAYLTVTEPIIRAELDSAIQVSPVLPDTNALSQLAEAEVYLQQALEQAGLEEYREDHPLEMEAALQGGSQLRLRVTTDDPERAARIANTWAAVLVGRLNDLYGTGEQTLAVLENEVRAAEENWAAAQQRLEEYLPLSRVDALQVTLGAARENLSVTLRKIDSNQLLISDARTLQAQLSVLPAETRLRTSTVIQLISLQQRAAGGPTITLQVEQALEEDLTAGEARSLLEDFTAALEVQILELEGEITALEERIAGLAVTLEEEQFRVEQLTQERNLARSAYTALSSQLEESRITQAQEERSAKIGAEAVVPEEPAGFSNLIVIGLAGGLGLLGACLLVYFYDWWKME